MGEHVHGTERRSAFGRCRTRNRTLLNLSSLCIRSSPTRFPVNPDRLALQHSLAARELRRSMIAAVGPRDGLTTTIRQKYLPPNA